VVVAMVNREPRLQVLRDAAASPHSLGRPIQSSADGTHKKGMRVDRRSAECGTERPRPRQFPWVQLRSCTCMGTFGPTVHALRPPPLVEG
jgi:hypothetical protein